MLHENVLLGFIFILLCAAFLLLVLYGNIKSSVGSSIGIMKSGLVKSSSIVDDFMGSFNYLGKLQEYTNNLAKRMGMSYYNSWLHLTACFFAALAAFRLSYSLAGLFPALSFSIMAAFAPYAVLKLLGDIYAEREKRYNIDFLSILHNFIKSSSKHDIFEALFRIIPYVVQPLKRYLEDMQYNYEHKTNPVTCLEIFKNNISSPELKLYIDNISICYVQGGDILGLTEAYVKEISTLDDDSDREDSEDRVLNYGLYVLIALNFGVVIWTLKGPYKLDILGNMVGQIIFVLDMFISMYIMYMTLKRS